MGSLGTQPKPQEERIIPASRRPDGTMRKPVRIRAGYVAQEEVAVYQSKAVQFKNGAPQRPPGSDPEEAISSSKPKTKAAKKNEKRKEKKHQKAAELQSSTAASLVDEVTQQIRSLEVSSTAAPAAVVDGVKSDVDKRIRALKKKIRIAEESKEDNNADKVMKLQAWREELKELQEK